MAESNHFGRQPSARCLSHPLVGENPSIFKSISAVMYCQNCGIAYSQSAGYFLRPSRFEAVYNTPAPHSSLLRNMIIRQRINRPLSTEHINPVLRLETVKWLQNLSVQLNLHKSTFARAVALMDKYLSQAPLDILDYNIVMIITLNLACKFGEGENRTLTVSQITQHLSGSYDKEEVAQWEIDIVSALGWNLDVQTAHDFANHFLWQGTATSLDLDQRVGPNDTDSQQILDCIDELVTKILDLTLIDFRFYRFTPVGLAASAMALARELVGFAAWTPELKEATGFSIESLKGCLDVLHQLARNEGVNMFLQKILARYQLGIEPVNPDTNNLLLQGEKSASCSALSAAIQDSPVGEKPTLLPQLPIGSVTKSIPIIPPVKFLNTSGRKLIKLAKLTTPSLLGRTGYRHNKIRKERW